MMETAIADFAKQFAFAPQIENVDALVRKSHVIVCGMGGSHLAADLIQTLSSQTPVTVLSDYDLRGAFSKEVLQHSLVITSSYSGNTEEVLSCYDQAKEDGLSLAAIAVGGKLLEQAKVDGIAYVQIPDTGIQPRSALGFSFRGLCALIGLERLLKESGTLADTLAPEEYRESGKQLAQLCKDQLPVIYSSRRNQAVAYNWKIKLNETGKIPAVYNVFPELNHNEMNGFDVQAKSQHLSKNMQVIFLNDTDDHPRVQKRMQVCAQLYRDRGIAVQEVPLEGDNQFVKVFGSLVLADWVAVHTAALYGLEAEQVPMIEEFKKMIA